MAQAAVVGGLGAAVTYSTLFSTARGRLDLIAAAFSCSPSQPPSKCIEIEKITIFRG